MIDIPLTKKVEGTKTITLSWTPVPCVGYVFYVNDTRVSNTWNPALTEITFHKVENGIYKVKALEIAGEGIYPKAQPIDSEEYNLEAYGSGVYSH